MSNIVDTQSAEVTRCVNEPNESPSIETIPAKIKVMGGGMKIRRALPTIRRRLVGPWCFLDHFGPRDITTGPAMHVGPHPHIGLQTVTWLLEGEVLHRDDLGCVQVIRPGQLNLMTAGRGITHSEETPEVHSDRIHGLQLWIALPNAHREIEPAFDHIPSLPTASADHIDVTVLLGEALGQQSPGKTYSPIIALDLAMSNTGTATIPLNPAFEHALMIVEGEVKSGDEVLEIGSLHYLGLGRESITLTNDAAAHAVLVGGEPLGEEIMLWWNFVARTQEEIEKARNDWAEGRHFGTVEGFDGPPLTAPEIHGRLKAT